MVVFEQIFGSPPAIIQPIAVGQFAKQVMPHL